MKDFLDSASSLFTRRFLLNAFLPVLIVISLCLLVVIARSGGLRSIGQWWSSQEGVTQVVILLGWLAAIWFLAGLLASQFRNLTQIFEGYPLTRSRHLQRLTAYLVRQHYLRSLRLKRSGRLDEALSRYPEKFEHYMPTTLGNTIRAAEMYSLYRYGMDLPLVWPRLATLAPERYRVDLEEFRTDYEWLLGLSALTSISAVALGTYSLVSLGPWWLFLICFAGGFGLAIAAYAAAVTAAAEYGEQLRVGVDLYRLSVLSSMGLALPKSLTAERRVWKQVQQFSKQGAGSPPRRALPPSAGGHFSDDEIKSPATRVS